MLAASRSTYWRRGMASHHKAEICASNALENRSTSARARTLLRAARTSQKYMLAEFPGHQFTNQLMGKTSDTLLWNHISRNSAHCIPTFPSTYFFGKIYSAYYEKLRKRNVGAWVGLGRKTHTVVVSGKVLEDEQTRHSSRFELFADRMREFLRITGPPDPGFFWSSTCVIWVHLDSILSFRDLMGILGLELGFESRQSCVASKSVDACAWHRAPGQTRPTSRALKSVAFGLRSVARS
ncbi:hypothetical protein C8R44DRAFT_749583 [Mycena epipterygia]|nr:hypothetical protein C8R44DRAFT_749583 [Mycena epipterygia]